jgi:hypothetical protein
MSSLVRYDIGRMVRQWIIRYAFDSYIIFLLSIPQWIFVMRLSIYVQVQVRVYCIVVFCLYLRKCLLFIYISQCQCLCFIYVYISFLNGLFPHFVSKRPSGPVAFQQGWKLGCKPQTIRQQRVVQDPDWVCTKRRTENFNSPPARPTRSMPLLCHRHDW